MKKLDKIIVEEVFKSDTIDERIKKLEDILHKLIKKKESNNY
ncbi:hypothetical protein [Alkaliphilus hydrothermalis]|uniref:Uncharacterized protein n=1 Tax=Alkaliphilus hydrothermalis TaxID=1482730 RepID=A0ABS2NRZ6_9FIRM|nr:hypothetical protein [Alkaliphilus hydrothermalis]MBM7615740.1 hypothetical protein [Alkaliphilus hydrothermalis]